MSPSATSTLFLNTSKPDPFLQAKLLVRLMLQILPQLHHPSLDSLNAWEHLAHGQAQLTSIPRFFPARERSGLTISS